MRSELAKASILFSFLCDIVETIADVVPAGSRYLSQTFLGHEQLLTLSLRGRIGLQLFLERATLLNRVRWITIDVVSKV